ncbi:hypothetical protein B0H17DRAFT_1161807 [Mycena rosella]|uniref:Uncharacterized protein n=1 Tax=Mycena rosella TaxID=1033263 RepID=A0AAD7G7A3_MYCRO|nr:hypothetical protein B0H17DRAFT_1161807 [Mycena rosella]
MVLEKRQRDGGFEPWRPAGSSVDPSPPKSTPTASSSRAHDDASPPAKKPRLSTVPITPILVTPKKPTLLSAPKPVTTAPAAASSSQPSVDEAPAKKGCKKAAEATPEKRGAIFKKKCPKNILDRVERVMTQRFYMVDRKRVEGELKEEFQVLGSTGNIYTVTIQQKPSCNCMNQLLFIFLKVLQVTQASGFWYQKALLTTELETIFENAPLAPNALAHPRICEAYARATGKTTGTPSTPESSPGPKSGSQARTTTARSATTACTAPECFAQWRQTSAKQHNKLTCIYCRAEWPAAGGGAGGSGAGGSRTTAGGYLNIRDTTTYYHGPRRGQRFYGYNGYEDD